jgi:hypothetical protein
MSTSLSVSGDGAAPGTDEPRIRAVRGPPPGRSGESAEVMLRVTQEHDRIAGDMDHIVVHRLFSAGLALETALGLMDGHPAAGKVEEAIGELDLAVAGFRTVLFDDHQPGSPPDGRRG